MLKDVIGQRMKENYENRSKIKLLRRTPVAIRIDGKTFHTFTKNFYKPFDRILQKTMALTMKKLCENVQGCIFGYTQSDEITLILKDYSNLESEAWFDYQVQKICSIVASMTTWYFKENLDHIIIRDLALSSNAENRVPYDVYNESTEKGVFFDVRCFNIPKEEVTNLIYWRQADALRNSVQMVAHAFLPHKDIQDKSCEELKEMLLNEQNINWYDYPIYCQRGIACKKKQVHEEGVIYSKWLLDYEMPILKGFDREYVEDLI